MRLLRAAAFLLLWTVQSSGTEQSDETPLLQLKPELQIKQAKLHQHKKAQTRARLHRDLHRHARQENEEELVAFRLSGTTSTFLACSTSSCSWGETFDLFQQDGGSFKIYNSAGRSTGSCLDREHCHSDDSNARKSECDHCGAIHWSFDNDTGKLAEDEGKNCIQESGEIEHCTSSFAVVEKTCPIEKQVITAIRCKNTDSSGACVAVSSGDVTNSSGAASNRICSACQGSAVTCSFEFTTTTSMTKSATYSSSTSEAFSLKASVQVGVEPVKVTAETGFTTTFSFQEGSSESYTDQQSVETTCSITAEAGTKVRLITNDLTTTIYADFEADVTTYFAGSCCGGTDAETVKGTMTISGVPTKTTIGSCESTTESCS